QLLRRSYLPPGSLPDLATRRHPRWICCRPLHGPLQLGRWVWATSDCGCSHEEEVTLARPADLTPWWQDQAMLIPALSGLTLLLGLLFGWLGAGLPAQVLFWLSLLLGASQFVPGALRGLLGERRLGIGLLMTVSALGAVLL